MLSAAGRNQRDKIQRSFFLLLFFALLQQATAGTIIEKELTVLRGDFKEVHYLIPKGTEKALVQGSFTCKGGLNDDVSFLIFTKDQYVRWYSNYKNKPIFKLEKKKEGKFEFPVQADETYYFVFDNFFSTVSNKQVKIQVQLESQEN
jgi:hypothetical protein